jgi:uncharacterized protein (UPF0335 family)
MTIFFLHVIMLRKLTTAKLQKTDKILQFYYFNFYKT